MGLRFRRSVRLFPGVRLNFSRSGISTTVGVRGAGLTFGPRGTYANVGIPGTGISYRTKISPTQAPEPIQHTPDPVVPQASPAIEVRGTSDKQQIHSAAVSEMTSVGLGELKRLINEAALRKIELIERVQVDEVRLAKTERKLSFARAFIIRLFTQRFIPRLAEEAQHARENLEDSRAELSGCYVDIDFGLDDATAGTFAAMCRSFEALCSCEKIWDITSTVRTDRIRERTTATQRLERSPVRFDFSQVDIIRSRYQTMRFSNVSGLEVHLYPGFVLTREPGSDFALIEWKDSAIQFLASRFIEEETVPNDSEVIGHTWAKSNKDGSPDRRFSNNYQIPIAKYGELWFKSPTGLLEAYMVSNCSKAENFAVAVSHHQDALSRLGERPEHALPTSIKHESDEAPEAPETPVIEIPPSTRRMYADWAALVLLVVGIVYSAYWMDVRGAKLLAGLAQPAAAVETEPKVTSVTELAQPEVAVRPIVYVQRNVVNLRSGPSASASIVRKAKKGARFNVFATKRKWTQVGDDDQPTGWILSSLLGTSPP